MSFWRRKKADGKKARPEKYFCIVKGYEHEYVNEGWFCLRLALSLEGGDIIVLSKEGAISLTRFLDYGEA